jgi:hypothetical protein
VPLRHVLALTEEKQGARAAVGMTVVQDIHTDLGARPPVHRRRHWKNVGKRKPGEGLVVRPAFVASGVGSDIHGV